MADEDKKDPIAKSDPAPHPIPAGEDGKVPAEPGEKLEDKPGNASGANVNPPTTLKGRKGKVHMIWVQPGHERLGVGSIFRVPADHAENLRGAGRARPASDGEVKAAGDDVADFETV